MDNPDEIEKVEEINEIVPETDEISPKLASADAIVSAFLEECRADIEKNAKNTEKIAENRRNLEEIGANRSNLEEIGANRRNLEENANPKEEFGGKCTNTNNANFVNWYFSGEVIRTILRFSLMKQLEIYSHFKISRSKFTTLLRSKAIMPEVTKFIAHKLGLNTPEELQEYYDNIPEDVKDSVRWDARIYRPLKPGIVIPSEIFKAAEKIGKLGEVIEAARVRQGR